MRLAAALATAFALTVVPMRGNAIGAPQPRTLFEPHAGFQREVLSAGEFEVFVGGAKGPGKTALLIAAPLRQIHKPEYRGLLVRSTYGEAQELIDRAHKIYPQLPQKPAWSGEHRRFMWPNGNYIKFGYLESNDDCERYQGSEPGFFGWDEFGKAKDPRAYETMLAELRSSNPDVQLQAMTTGNPGQRNHGYIKRRFITPCGELGGRVWYRVKMRRPDGSYIERLVARRFIPGRVWDNPIYANDPQYLATLHSLNERDRKYLLYGSWDNPDGLAFGELEASKHIVKPFRVPDYWPMFAGHDWGYAHPWAFTWYAVNEDGRMFVVDTIWGRRQKDSAIADRVVRRAPIDRLTVPTFAGTDVFSKIKARQEDADAPSTSERYLAAGWIVQHANTDRAQGTRTLRECFAWRGNGRGGADTEPQLVFMDTRGNRRLFEQIESLTTDPDDPEDVLKIDASPDTGEGGDDGFDTLRYAVHSRRMNAPETWFTDREWSINDPDVLRMEAERKMRGTHQKEPVHRISTIDGYAG